MTEESTTVRWYCHSCGRSHEHTAASQALAQFCAAHRFKWEG